MTQSPQPTDRLDRVEALLLQMAERQEHTDRQIDQTQRTIDTLAVNQVEERDRRLELREDLELLYQAMLRQGENMEAGFAQAREERAELRSALVQLAGATADAREERAELRSALAQLGTRMEQLAQQISQLGSRVDQTSSDIYNLALQLEAQAQVAEQDRSQAALDRAEFRSTVERLLQVLTQQYNGNGGQ